MQIDTGKMKTVECTIILKGLVDVLVALYPDSGSDDDEGFFAVLMQAQRVATELKDHIQDGDNELTPFSMVG